MATYLGFFQKVVVLESRQTHVNAFNYCSCAWLHDYPLAALKTMPMPHTRQAGRLAFSAWSEAGHLGAGLLSAGLLGELAACAVSQVGNALDEEGERRVLVHGRGRQRRCGRGGRLGHGWR